MLNKLSRGFSVASICASLLFNASAAMATNSAVEIPITDLVEGTNVVTIGADTFIATSNVNIVFVNGVFH